MQRFSVCVKICVKNGKNRISLWLIVLYHCPQGGYYLYDDDDDDDDYDNDEVVLHDDVASPALADHHR